MALTRSDIPDLLLPGLRTEFDLAYRNLIQDGVAEQLATIINTTIPVQRYGWLAANPVMREFIDERRPQGIGQNSWSIADKTFEATLAVDRKAMEDDQLDLIRLRVRDMAERVAVHRHQLVVEALVAGEASTSYDGAAFFGTHSMGVGGSAENTGLDALSSSTLATSMSTMMGFTDDQGIPLGIIPDTLLVGPSNWWTALELVESVTAVHKSDANSTNHKNVFRGKLKVVLSPFLRGASAANWFLLDTTRAMRAIILQQRSDVPIEFTALEGGSSSEAAFMRDQYLYGVRGRYNVGYGLWQTAFGQFA